MSVESITGNQPRGLEQKWKILISVMFGIFMIILDSTVVNVAFPTLRREFGATLADTQWVLSIYVLSLGVTTPVSGFLADRFGIKRVYLFGLAIFVIGSFLCGLAPSLGWLILARALQGFGGGLSQPLGPAQLYRAFPPKEQGTALGYFGIVLVFAPALGPVLGGWLVDANLWRLIFFINIPIGILGVILGSRFLLDHRVESKPTFDPLGLITAVIGFGAVLYAASIAESNGWTGPTTLLAFGIGLFSLIVHVIIELRVRQPMTSLRLFGNPLFLNAALVGYVATLAMFGAEFLMPVYLQAFRGRTALETGYILLAIAIPSGIATPLAGRLYDKIGPRMNLIVGFGILCINTWQLSMIGATTPISYILFLLALRGLAFGLTLQTSFVAALSAMSLDELPRGSSLLNSTRFVVQAVSVAALATVVSSAMSADIRSQQDQMQEAQTSASASVRFGVCETPGVRPEDNLPPGTNASLASLSQATAAAAKTRILSTLQTACDQGIRGFENAYRITFFASIGALILGALLPGWPGKWGGRGSGAPMPAAD